MLLYCVFSPLLPKTEMSKGHNSALTFHTWKDVWEKQCYFYSNMGLLWGMERGCWVDVVWIDLINHCIRGHFCVGWGSGYACFCFSQKKTSCYSQVFCICAFHAGGQSCSAPEGSLCCCTVCGRWCKVCLLYHYLHWMPRRMVRRKGHSAETPPLCLLLFLPSWPLPHPFPPLLVSEPQY